MITGIGVDMVQVQRMKKWRDNPGLLERYFHPEELSIALKNESKAELSLAARFAAKEAFGKALGTGLAGMLLRDIMIKNRHNGKPEMIVSNTALAALDQNGANRIHVSLSHERDYAIAMVVLEYLPSGGAGDPVKGVLHEIC